MSKLLIILCITQVCHLTASADEKPAPAVIAATRIAAVEEYTLRVSFPGGADKVLRFTNQKGDTENSRTGWRVMPYVLPFATAADGKGQVKLSFEFPGQKEPTMLRSAGLTEDVYLLRLFGDEKESKKWLDKVVPESKLVVPWPEKDAHLWDWEPKPVGDRLEKVPPKLAAAVKLGTDAYAANRPELMRRFGQSLLYYPLAPEQRWAVTVGKDALWLETGCADRMFAAFFRVELQKTKKGEWEVIRIFAKEVFKGE
jgi:hypothetical protein